MFKRKKRILFVSEASYSKTGFGRYYYDLISNLYKSNKYDIAELGCFGDVNHDEDGVIKWKYYANQPDNEQEIKAYNSNSNNKVGMYRFNKVLIDFLPDIVICARDIAMDGWISISPLRKYFTWIIAPPVDSAPQSNNFLGYYYEADHIVPYTDYAVDVIKKEAPNCNLDFANYPGIDPDLFYPLDKKKCREKIGLPLDKKIVGFVARNQIRKLFPHILRDFRLFLDKFKREDIVLHLHTTYPDLSHWNLPKYLIETGLESKVYITLYCNACKYTTTSHWLTDNTKCPKCNNVALSKMKINHGPTNEELNEIYNCYDLYLQYAKAEGLGVPLVEASVAGIPCAAINYTAQADVVRLTEGILLEPLILERDLGTDSLRAIPDPQALVSALDEFFKKSDAEILEIKKRTREKALDAFSPVKNAIKWMELIDSIEPKNLWFSRPEEIPKIDISGTQFKSISDMAYSILERVIPGDPILYSYHFDELIRHANRGIVINGGVEKYGPKNVIDWIESYLKNRRYIEDFRSGNKRLDRERFMEYAESKEVANL